MRTQCPLSTFYFILFSNLRSGPKFELIATASLSLDEASDLSHTYDLTIQPPPPPANSSSTSSTFNNLPLFGHYCCRLAVQPDHIETAACTGPLSVQARGPATRPHDGYARLQAFRLDFWDEESQQHSVQPRRSIDVTRDTKVKHRGELDLVLSCMEDGRPEEYTLRSATLTEASQWYAALKKCIKEHSVWRHLTAGGSSAMQLAAPANMKTSFLRASTRQRSLYDQVPIIGKNATAQKCIEKY